jgi:hypothetical protein
MNIKEFLMINLKENIGFLNKVIDQIVRETELDYVDDLIHVPFLHYSAQYPLFTFFSYSDRMFSYFVVHCKDVYGVNEDEVEYVWNEYKFIIEDKIDNG